MKKRLQKILGVMLSTSMVLTPMIETVAAVNSFDVAAEDVTGKVLFPGDSISGIQPIYMGPDGSAMEVVDGMWINDTSQAYSMSAIESEEGGLWLEPKGYVLTVNGGTSKASGTDGSDTSNHFKAQKETKEDALFQKDVAYYEAGTDVTVIADSAPEGQIFDHWEIEGVDVALTDSSAEKTNFVMAEDEVILSAVYVEAPVETEPPTEAPAPVETEPPTEAPAPVETEPPTEAPAPVETEPPTEAPAPVETEPPTEAPAPVETEPPTEAPAPVETEPQAPEEVPLEEEIIQVDEPVIEETQPAADEPVIIDVVEETSAPALYSLVVENGSGSGDYEVGTEVTITADTVEGMVFAGWTTDAVTVWFADAFSAQTTFSMPAETVTVKANLIPAETSVPETTAPEVIVPETELIIIEDANNAAEPEEIIGEDGEVIPDLYTVEVEFGEGSGSYEAGAEVYVYADAPADGQVFAGWMTSENLVLEDPFNEEAYFIMPADTVKLTATYTVPETMATEVPVDETPEELNETEMLTEENSENATAETEDVYVETETETELQSEQSDTEEALITRMQIQLSSTEDITLVGDYAVDEYGLPVAAPGEKVTLEASEYENMVLDSWIITMTDDSKEIITPTIDPEDPYVASFIMPNVAVYVEVIYTELANNEVQIVNGSGSGTYQEGDYVEITANDPEEGYRFKGWKVITENVDLDDAAESVTGFVMPDEAVQIKAVYEVIKYTLTVENGSGDGSYVKGEKVNLTADYPASGKVFAGWVVTTENAAVSASDRYYSGLTMPAANVTVKATYKDGPSPDYNEIQNIVSGGEYLKSQTITFTAAGNGMNNSNPNPGDYRYRPTGYQIGSVTGSWNNAPYTTSMAINAVGQYTLTVSYSKDIFDGNSWVASGSYDSKSVTFYVVNALSVQTGDTSPIIPLVIAAIAALAVIIVVLVVRRRRR